MTEKEKFAALKLALSENIGPMTYKGLIAYFKNPVAAVENLPNFLKNNKRRSIKIAPDSLVYSQFEMAEKLGAEILVLNLYLYGYSYDEIAKNLNKNVKSVDNALSRARKKIIKGLEK